MSKPNPKFSEQVAYRKDESFPPSLNAVEYEKEIYQRGLALQRPPFSFQTGKWQADAEARMSAESKGYASTALRTAPHPGAKYSGL